MSDQEQSEPTETAPKQEPAPAQPQPQQPEPQAQPQQPEPQAQPQAQPQIVVPPPQQPPAPPANAQEVIARQEAALAAQIAQAQARDRAQFGAVAEGVGGQPAPVMGGAFQQAAQQQQPPPAPGVNLPSGFTAQQVAQGLPQQSQIQPQQNPFAGGLAGLPNPAIAQGPDAVAAAMIAAGLPDPSVPQNGVTVAQLNQQAHIQGAPPPSYAYPQGQQPQLQQSVSNQKPTVRWHPGRNSKTVIEFNDSILTGLPDGIEQVSDPQAKVVVALLMEILYQRERIMALEQAVMQGGGASPELEGRVQLLERTLFEQTQSLKQGAQAYREEQVRVLAEQNTADPQTPANPPESSS